MGSNNTPLRKQITEQIFTVTDFFSSEECDAYIELTEKAGYRDAPITTSRGPQMRPEIRNNTRVMICLLYTSPSPRDQRGSRMPSSA